MLLQDCAGADLRRFDELERITQLLCLKQMPQLLEFPSCLASILDRPDESRVSRKRFVQEVLEDRFLSIMPVAPPESNNNQRELFFWLSQTQRFRQQGGSDQWQPIATVRVEIPPG